MVLLILLTVTISIILSLLDVYLRLYHSSLKIFLPHKHNTLLNANRKYYAFSNKTECVNKVKHPKGPKHQRYSKLYLSFFKSLSSFILENILEIFIYLIISGLDVFSCSVISDFFSWSHGL